MVLYIAESVRTLASSLTPCLFTPCKHLLFANSLIVIGLLGSSLPWSIQLCILSRLIGLISTLNGLYFPRPRSGLVIHWGVWPPSKPAGTLPWAC
jgi:hypothetical protein